MNKKYILIVIMLAMAFLSHAQSKKRKTKQKPTYTLGISGGYFSYGKMFENSENDFAGLKTFQIEVQKLYKSRKSGFSLGFLSQKSEYKPYSTIVDESRFALMLNYNLMNNLMKNRSTSGLYLGGFVGVLFDRGEQLPRSNFAFPIYTTYVSLWTGPEAEYIYQINPKLFLSVGGRLGLLEFGRRSTKRENPQLPVSFQSKSETYFSLAQRINLNLGVHITL